MPRKLFKRWSPDPHTFRQTPGLQFLGKLLHDPNLFHLNRHSVSVAFFSGIFIAFLPVPGQIAIAAGAAFWLRCNLPITLALIWISNPLTFPIIFFTAYKFGNHLLGYKRVPFSFELSWQWLTEVFPSIWQPLLLGCISLGLLFGCIGFLFIQWSWRWHVIDKWKKRREKRLIRNQQKTPYS